MPTDPNPLPPEGATAAVPAAPALPPEATIEAPPDPAPTETAAGPAAATEAAAKVPDLSPAACAAALAQHFPALFGTGVLLPVKLRIQADIQQRSPGVFTRKSLSLFLHRHTTSTAYIKALLVAPTRFDLDGQAAGEVSEEHRVAAQTELDRRRALMQERRQAQRQQAPRPDAASAASASGAAVPGEAAAPAGRAERRGAPVRLEAAQSRAPERSAGPRRDAASHGRPRDRQGDQKAAGSGGRHDRPHTGQGRPEQRPPHDRSPPRAAATADAAPQPPVSTGDPVVDAARRERNALLRSYESSTLTKANFLVLKRMSEADLDAQLALARQERQQAGGGASASAARDGAPRR